MGDPRDDDLKVTLDTPSGTPVLYNDYDDVVTPCTLVQVSDATFGPWPAFNNPRAHNTTYSDTEVFVLGWRQDGTFDPYWVVNFNRLSLSKLPDQSMKSLCQCPKCSSSLVEFVALANKCKECWYTW